MFGLTKVPFGDYFFSRVFKEIQGFPTKKDEEPKKVKTFLLVRKLRGLRV